MTAYYNEIDPYAAQWLRNLIKAGHIARGDVDERSIVDVAAAELRGYTQCHFFAGIGGWSIALRLAGWPDDRPVWTGSCPCQPFSAAGAGKAFDDERHLWPTWFSLIAECRPPAVFGEQVEAAVGWGWLDTVFFDLESQGYACGAAVLPACSVGAPHIRNRLWFVAHADGGHAGTEWLQRGGEHGQQPEDRLSVSVAHSESRAAGTGSCDSDAFAERRPLAPNSGCIDSWSQAEWLQCTDGKARPIGPGTSVLAHGIQRRASKLRAYGNAIVPQIAAEFIRAAS